MQPFFTAKLRLRQPGPTPEPPVPDDTHGTRPRGTQRSVRRRPAPTATSCPFLFPTHTHRQPSLPSPHPSFPPGLSGLSRRPPRAGRGRGATSPASPAPATAPPCAPPGGGNETGRGAPARPPPPRRGDDAGMQQLGLSQPRAAAGPRGALLRGRSGGGVQAGAGGRCEDRRGRGARPRPPKLRHTGALTHTRARARGSRGAPPSCAAAISPPARRLTVFVK